MALSDRVVVMQRGSMLQVGPPETIYQRPVSREVAAFFGTPNFLEGQVTGGTQLGQGQHRLAVTGDGWHGECLSAQSFTASEQVLVMVRPENMVLAAADTPIAPGQIGWHGRVTDCIFRGSRRSIMVANGATVFNVDAPAMRAAAVGDRVTLLASAESAWALPRN